jgi:hypothetical protein
MSYTQINDMRSARYPLQGCGTGNCGGMGTATDTANQYAWTIPLGVGLVVGLGAIFSFGEYNKGWKKPKKNRRRRR